MRLGMTSLLAGTICLMGATPASAQRLDETDQEEEQTAAEQKSTRFLQAHPAREQRHALMGQ